MNDLEDIRKRALDLMDALGEIHMGESLVALGWTLQFDRARRRLGACKWMRKGKNVKIISLSKHYALEGGWELMEDVVRHEIAHAVQFEQTGASDHGPLWRQLARIVGADPSRVYEGDDLSHADSKYVGVCPSCGGEQPFYRIITRPHGCPPCCREHNGGRYDARFRLRLVERATGLEIPVRRRRRRTLRYF